MVDDIQWLEATGRTRGTTWARNKKESQRSKHTMGYQIRERSSEYLQYLLNIKLNYLTLFTATRSDTDDNHISQELMLVDNNSASEIVST